MTALVIIYLTSLPIPELKAEVTVSAFSVKIGSAYGRGDLTLYPAAQPEAAQTISRADLPKTVEDLVPATAYILACDGRQTRFMTPEADSSLWARDRSQIYTASRFAIESIFVYPDTDLADYLVRKGVSVGDSIVLENQASQGTCAYLICTAKYMKEIPDGEVPLVMVLRLENGEIYQNRQTAVFSDQSCKFLIDVTGLFEQRYNAFHTHFYGNASFELYVNGGQAGYAAVRIGQPLSGDR